LTSFIVFLQEFVAQTLDLLGKRSIAGDLVARCGDRIEHRAVVAPAKEHADLVVGHVGEFVRQQRRHLSRHHDSCEADARSNRG
jgi:hypothetical protein